MTSRLDGDGLWVSEGVNHLSSLGALLGMARRWPAMRRDLLAADGYVRHRVFFEAPRTVGLLVWWRSEGDPWRYARGAGHDRLRQWGDAGATTGGWMVVYRAHRLGPVWGSGHGTVQVALGRGEAADRPAGVDRRDESGQ